MTVPEFHPRFYHRARRDHHLRILFSNGQRLVERRGSQPKARLDMGEALREALYHAQETLRERDLEWPGGVLESGDAELCRWLSEMEAWLQLSALLSSEPDLPGEHLDRFRELIGHRLQQGLAHFHARRSLRVDFT